MDSQQELLKLKDQLVNDLTPLVEKTTGDPQEKFTILMALGRRTNASANFWAAREAAQKIENEEARLEALMELLEEVDFQLRPLDEVSEESVVDSGPENNPDNT